MSVTFCKSSIAGALLTMLAGCSLLDGTQVTAQNDIQWSEKLGPTTNQNALEACSPEQGTPFHFRKNILLVGTVGASGIASDLPGLAHLTSTRLQTHLDALERFNVIATHDSSFESNVAARYSSSYEAMPSGTAANVRQLGQEYSTQFVVKLEFENLTIFSNGWLSNVIPNLLPSLFKANARRNVQMKLYIYDTEYGALVKSQQYRGHASGNVVGYPGGGHAVSTPWFKTDLGTEVDDMLEAMSIQINEELACVPFSTQITEVNGNNITINAGFLNGIRPGGTLRAYPETGIQTTHDEKIQPRNEVWIKVKSVRPNYSIVTLNEEYADNNSLGIGDLVRAW